MSYTLPEITEILGSQKKFLQKKYGLQSIGIFNYNEQQTDFIVKFEKPRGMMFIDFCEFIESILNVNADVITEEALENMKDESLKNGIKNKVKYV